MTTPAPPAPAISPEFFKNRKEAHRWLLANGYKVAQGKFYQDIDDKGFPILNSDKTVSKYQVAVYGKSLETPSTPNPEPLERHGYMHRKEKAEAEIAEMKATRMQREEDENWLHKDDAWAAVAGVMGSLKDCQQRHVHDAMVEITKAAGGDPARAPEVYECVVQIVNRAFNEIAGDSIDIQWEAGE